VPRAILGLNTPQPTTNLLDHQSNKWDWHYNNNKIIVLVQLNKINYLKNIT